MSGDSNSEELQEVTGTIGTTKVGYRPELPTNYSRPRFFENQDKTNTRQLETLGKNTVDDKSREHATPCVNNKLCRRSKNYPVYQNRDNDSRATMDPEEDKATSSASRVYDQSSILSKRKINCIWDPCNSSDITVHLKMSCQEDLEESLEEFCRLQRLGDFISAKRFFKANLQDHLDKPYIIIEYAELLLEQGDFNALSGIDDTPIYITAGEATNNDDGNLLRLYWQLILAFGASHKPSPYSEELFGNLDKFDTCVNEALHGLHTMIEPNAAAGDGDISSTEIKMISLVYRLNHTLDSSINERLGNLFPSQFYRNLYINLLRHGRVWDIHDITVARIPSVDISKDWSDNPLLWKRIQSFIDDWLGEINGYDTSTILALLSVLMSYAQKELLNPERQDKLVEYLMDQSTSLAISIMKKDPNSMKSRPFMKWILMKTRSKDTNDAVPQLQHLQSSPGAVYYNKNYRLPRYIPLKTENPGWRIGQAIPDLEAPLRMVIKATQILGDYQTEVMALLELVRISTEPAAEFERLGNLQMLIQGDVRNYSKTLVSKYLVCKTEDSRNDLKKDIAELLSIPSVSRCLEYEESWALWMLRHSLESDVFVAKDALERADQFYERLFEELREEVDGKIPDIRQRVFRENDN